MMLKGIEHNEAVHFAWEFFSSSVNVVKILFAMNTQFHIWKI